MTKAAVMYAYNEPLTIESVELRAPRADEVVVKLGASGVCHSDLSALQGKLGLPAPAVLGHEGAGIIEEVGAGVAGLRPGDHVVLSWAPECGQCAYCLKGRPYLCTSSYEGWMQGLEGTFSKGELEIFRMTGVGTFAERSVVRAAACIKIPTDVPLDRACLIGCGVMTGVGAAINTAQIRPGDTVAVFGCGGVGLNVIQGAALCGAERIIAVDLVDQKLQWAKEFGATDTINGKQTDAPEAIRGLTDGLGVDYAFEVIGAQASITQAIQSLRRGGNAVIVGVVAVGQDIAVPGAMFGLEEKSLRGCLYGSGNLRRDIPHLLSLYMQKRLKLDELISRRIKLDDINAAFAAMEKGEVARSVIVYD
jgi:S-(hydroxymethyl)glutathione dehydrogenase / alcohol dehydrogenase